MKYILLIVIFLLSALPVHADSLVNVINAHRSRPVIENSILDKTASIKACDMIANHYWSHYDLQGRAPWHLFYENGYYYRYAGENIARGYFSDSAIVQAWLNSPTHKTIMLSNLYREVGIGRCGNIVVAHFASR